jgi:hypothetical protein
MTAQAVPPPITMAQLDPAQQSVAIESQRSPAATHRSPVGAAAVGTHTAPPAGPAHEPLQQSSIAVQGAPRGAQVA